MGYALFAQRKIVLDGELNLLQLRQTQKSNEQFKLATESSNLQQKMTSMTASQAGELAEMYARLASAPDSDARESINAQIRSMEQAFQQELDEINREIYQVEVKENAIEMEVKRLDTMVTAVEKQLEAVEDAESDAIDRATPKYNGVG